jgi:hypothetical protein
MIEFNSGEYAIDAPYRALAGAACHVPVSHGVTLNSCKLNMVYEVEMDVAAERPPHHTRDDSIGIVAAW